MVELDGVVDAGSLGGGIDYCVASVVVEGRSNAESVPCAEVPGLVWSGFVVDGDFLSNWDERCGVVVDGTVVVFPILICLVQVWLVGVGLGWFCSRAGACPRGSWGKPCQSLL